MITRNNYEEFFLLYVDNELSAAERQVVERFVADNPDLREEWEALLDCRLSPDPGLVFGEPDSLFRQAAPEQYESLFLSYIDGELDEAGRSRVEEWVRETPSLALELELLKKTISAPDTTLVFADKDVLYKKERRVVALPWARMAAAAVVLLAIGLFFSPLNKRSANSRKPIAAQGTLVSAPPAKQTDPGKKERIAVTPPAPDSLHLQEKELVKRNKEDGQPDGRKKEGLLRKKGEERPAPSDLVAKQTNANAGEKSLPNRDATLPNGDAMLPNRDATLPDRDAASTAETRPLRPASSESGRLAETRRKADRINPAGTEIKSTISFTSLAVQDNQDENAGEDGAELSSPSIRKTKLRGLFRKVSRVFEKTTSADDTDDKRKVLIGSFQFALK
jgi:anti-sigma factor RsiW